MFEVPSAGIQQTGLKLKGNAPGMDKVLIVDDEDSAIKLLRWSSMARDFKMLTANSGEEALEVIKKENPAAVLLDLKMPGMDGIETMKELNKIAPGIPVIIISAYCDIPCVVKAIKLGAYDFITKPPEIDVLVLTLKRAIEKSEMEQKIKNLDTAVETSLEIILGKSRAIKHVIEQVRQISGTNYSVIIQGETGAGKQVVAQTIHNLSARAENPFVKVDMGVIPETLVESKLFGHEKGAFTGAEKKTTGIFSAADGGTIFIDELQNMSPHIQSKLLSAVEDRRIYPVGSNEPLEIDVRLISATNEDIRENMKKKKLREDFFYRLGDFIITLPPLRERVEDISYLAKRFSLDSAAELKKNIFGISDDAIDLLMRYPWPGNIRELKNVMKRAALYSRDGVIRPGNIEFLIHDKFENVISPLKDVVSDLEEKTIRQALSLAEGNKSRAASTLQIDYKTLLRKLKGFGIR